MSRVLASNSRDAAFTFVEVLMALLVASITVGVAAMSLTTSLTAEETSMLFQEAGLVVQTVSCQVYLHQMPTGSLVAATGEWDLGHFEVDAEDEEQKGWLLITASPAAKPSLAFKISFQRF